MEKKASETLDKNIPIQFVCEPPPSPPSSSPVAEIIYRGAQSEKQCLSPELSPPTSLLVQEQLLSWIFISYQLALSISILEVCYLKWNELKYDLKGLMSANESTHETLLQLLLCIIKVCSRDPSGACADTSSCLGILSTRENQSRENTSVPKAYYPVEANTRNTRGSCGLTRFDVRRTFI